MGDLAQVTSFWVRSDKPRVYCHACSRAFVVTARRIMGKEMSGRMLAVQAPKGWAMNIKTGEVTCSEKCRE